MADFTIKRTDDMETILDGIVHRARASLGATSIGMQVMHFPADWEGYPNHDHLNDSADANDLGQEEIYIALDGSATLLVDGDTHTLQPGVLARVGPGQKRRILPGRRGFAWSPWAAGRARHIARRRGPSSAARFPCRLARIAHKQVAERAVGPLTLLWIAFRIPCYLIAALIKRILTCQRTSSASPSPLSPTQRAARS